MDGEAGKKFGTGKMGKYSPRHLRCDMCDIDIWLYIVAITSAMRIDDIFVPKGNGLGWTLNFDNPLSWVVLLLLVTLVYMLTRQQLKQLVDLVKGYFRK